MEIFQQNAVDLNNYLFKLPLYEAKVSAGFPSPADDYVDKKLSLDEYLISSPASTFFVRAIGNSMIKTGIFEGSLLVVDKSVQHANNKIVIAVVNGEFTVKKLKTINSLIYLVSENDDFMPILLTEESYIWGVVIAVINKL